MAAGGPVVSGLTFHNTTITNSQMGCTFWGSDECVASVPCLFYYAVLLHATKSYLGEIFCFHEQHI